MSGLSRFLRHRNLATLSSTVFLILTGMMTWYYLLPLHLRDLGASDAQVGLVFTALSASYALMQFVGGLLADRFGRKAVIVVPTFLFIPFYLGAAFAHRWYELMAFLVIVETLAAIQWPAFVALIAESVSEDRTGRAFGVFEFAAGLGFVVGPALGAWLVKFLNPGRLIAISALMAVICAPLRALLLEEGTYTRREKAAASWREFVTPSILPMLLVAVFLACMNNLCLWGPFFALHAEDVWHWDRPHINRIMAAGSVAATLASFTAGRMADRYGASRAMALGAVAHSASMLALVYLGPSWGFWPLLVLTFVASQLSWVAYNAMVSRLAPSGRRGGTVGLLGTVSGVVGAFAPGAGGLLRERYGSVAPFWLALVCSIGIVFALLLRRRRPRVIYTVGHSVRSMEEMISLLREYDIEAVVDVRRFPRSRRNPQFNREVLERALTRQGIEYHWLGEELGGFRPGGYEAYISSDGFEKGINLLEGIARRRQTAVMCAEKLWFRCHRRFIADEMARRGWEVLHIIEPHRKAYRHRARS